MSGLVPGENSTCSIPVRHNTLSVGDTSVVRQCIVEDQGSLFWCHAKWASSPESRLPLCPSVNPPTVTQKDVEDFDQNCPGQVDAGMLRVISPREQYMKGHRS